MIPRRCPECESRDVVHLRGTLVCDDCGVTLDTDGTPRAQIRACHGCDREFPFRDLTVVHSEAVDPAGEPTSWDAFFCPDCLS